MPPILTAEHLEKHHGPRVIFKDVSFAVDAGERIGLVGRNGTGKSTLARIVAGLEAPDAGVLSFRQGTEVAFLAQEPVLDANMTVLEEVLSGLTRWRAAMTAFEAASQALAGRDGDAPALLDQQSTAAAADVERLGGWNQSHRAETYLAHLGITDVHARVGPLSGGEKRRVALAKILVAAPDLAILDEPTNHLDVEAVEWLEEHLEAEFSGAIWLITHDRYVLDRVATRTLELEQGRLYSYDGGYGRYLEDKAARMAQEARTEANRQNFLRTEIEWLRRMPKARTTKQKARIDRAEAAMKERGPSLERSTDLQVDTRRLGKTIVDLKSVSITVNGRELVHDLSLSLTEGERLGIIGRNGAGKTTLVRAILGTLDGGDVVVRGEITRGQNTAFTYFDQLRAGLDDEGTILENVAGGRLRVEVGGRIMDARAYLERFLFEPGQQRQRVGSLSGGERARVALAKHLLRPANVLILDEPTNDLDVATLSALEGMLVGFPGCCLLVSHDRFFLDRVATSILAFEGEGRVVHQAGNYSIYRALKDRRDPPSGATGVRGAASPEPVRRPRALGDDDHGLPTVAAGPSRSPTEAGMKALTYAERLELETLLDRVGAAEERVKLAEARLEDPTLYAGRAEGAPAAVEELERARAEVAALTARWEHLEARREATVKGRG